jgi:LmbE family N-acetylglucosaminyl deacetylase
MKKENLIVFAAHPDDEVLGCGGTIKKLSKKYNIISVFFTTGVTSRLKNKSNSKIKNLKKNCMECNKILGTKKVIFFDLVDNKLDIYPRLDIIKKIEEVLNKYKPSIIFTHYFEDLNIDHEIVSKSVVTSCRPNKRNSNIKKIYFFETLSNTEWSVNRKFQPNYFSDITKFIKFKIKAMSKYKSELQPKPMPRNLENIKNLAKLRGSEINKEFAEAFFLYREIE